jgi:ribonuclease T1
VVSSGPVSVGQSFGVKGLIVSAGQRAAMPHDDHPGDRCRGLGLALPVWPCPRPVWARESSPAPPPRCPPWRWPTCRPGAGHRTAGALGRPFPYEKDGIVFGNRERLLPRQSRGYYREYTVPTPGARDRGARRLVCGGRQPRNPDACFYTDDHYASFRRVLP